MKEKILIVLSMTMIYVVIFIGMYIPLAFLYSLVFCDLWLWFVVPIFDLPILTKLQALGFMMVVAFPFANKANIQFKDQNDKVNWPNVCGMVIGPFLTWGMGAIIHSLM